MRDDLEVFIVCHDQDIILKDIDSKKFSKLPNHKFLFVGDRDCSKIENIGNVIICKNLPNNIEHEKLLVSFTAWYAVSKNDLTDCKYISILEYDIDLSPDFYEKNLDVMQRCDGFIGYRVYPLSSPLFGSATHWLHISMKDVYNVNVDQLITDYIRTTGKNSWCSSSNCTLSKELLDKFVDWFMPLTNVFKHDKLGAHVHERTIKLYSIINKVKTYYIPNVLTHWQHKSHKIEALI